MIPIPSHPTPFYPTTIHPCVIAVSLVFPSFVFTYSHLQALLYIAIALAGLANGPTCLVACLVFSNTLGPSLPVYEVGALSSQGSTFFLDLDTTSLPKSWQYVARQSSMPSTGSTMTMSAKISTSDTTLYPETDGVSDFQQYVEKISRRGSRGDASLVHFSPTEGEAQRQDSLVGTPAPTMDKETRLSVPALPLLEGTGSGLARKDKTRRLHRVEAAEDPHEYPGPIALSLLTGGICLSVFLVSLDRTIVATVRASW